MKTLFLDCSMGAAGDMLTAALMELLPNPDAFVKEFNLLGIPGVTMVREKSVKCGITGTHVRILVNGEEEGTASVADSDRHHHHTGMADICRIVSGLNLENKVRKDIQCVYSEIAQAESSAHGMPVDQIHFHEVGTMDALADVTAVCMLIEKIHPDRILATPVCVGFGTVKCAHGILPVPAPATAFILKNIPVYGGNYQGELCTPTGAALLKHFVSEFSQMPSMCVKTVGYGMGMKDFPQANCVRAFLGISANCTDSAVELVCNVDDMTGEEIGFAVERLMENGALDVYTVPIGMKKSRPGTAICVLCRETDKEIMVRLVFKYTTTIGVRSRKCERCVMDRTEREIDTPYGVVHRKESAGYGVSRIKYEYEDLARIAREKETSISEILKEMPRS